MNPNILIVDDDPSIRRLLAMTLAFAGFMTTTVSTAKEGLKKGSDEHFHLILLDLGLPDMSGVQFLERYREDEQTPVIVVSAIHDQTDKIAALNAGADDYVTKPFNADELIARIHANLRRVPPPQEKLSILIVSDMRMDISNHIVSIADNPIKLTPKEFKLLHIFMENQGKALTHAWLLKAVWGVGYQHETHYLRVFINQLRQKIETDPARPKWILTETGIGYRFVG
ncbi:MAG: response regulator transcription factor [Sulfuricurvum sp.]|uniref:response regulator n=1 Tax=Sulfuricurvum sp. TaxID=2025608 RepID=UPI002616DC3F|nr:response regulator transcription factor [Sulfuricurvum sp.]MDD2830021.1 response regulator transcription factor [Sulfuricurvum sp.]MDD4948894.1 response regulator transcription factor [Sulfuricurvum sp.]